MLGDYKVIISVKLCLISTYFCQPKPRQLLFLMREISLTPHMSLLE